VDITESLTAGLTTSFFQRRPMTENILSMDLAYTDTRISIYRWLSTLFAKEIDPKTLDEYRQGAGVNFLKSLSTISAFTPGVRALQDLMEQETATGDLALELAGDFGFLFLGSGGQQSVPPYESVYTSHNGTMFQEAEQQTRRILEKYGLGVCKNVREPADHIAVQLELMAHLFELSAKSAVTDDDQANTLKIEQKTFLEDHLLNWVPVFCANCVKNDPGGFYAALAQLMVTMLKETHLYLTDDY